MAHEPGACDTVITGATYGPQRFDPNQRELVQVSAGVPVQVPFNAAEVYPLLLGLQQNDDGLQITFMRPFHPAGPLVVQAWACPEGRTDVELRLEWDGQEKPAGPVRTLRFRVIRVGSGVPAQAPVSFVFNRR